MTEFRAADHAMGLELQLEELNEQRNRAVAQGQDADERGLTKEIEALQTELAEAAERAAVSPPEPDPEPVFHDAHELRSESPRA